MEKGNKAMKILSGIIPRFLISALLILPSPILAHDSLDFFVTEVPGACTASNPTNAGTYQRIYLDSATCNGLPRYHWVRGGNRYPWASESFIVKDGFIRGMNEISIKESTGQFTQYRVFRDMTASPPSKGVLRLKRYFSSPVSWGLPYFVEEYWLGPNGYPVCYNTQHDDVVTGSVNWGSVQHLGTWPAFLQDKRSVSHDPSAWHDVQVILLTEQWGTNNYEYYYFGRWYDDVAGKWRGLGLVKWQWFQGSQLKKESTSNFLVNCNAKVTCTTCPP